MAVADGAKVNSPWLPDRPPTVTQQFGVLESLPQFGINGPHEGVDLAGQSGDRLMLPSGVHATVQNAGWDPYGGGNFVNLHLDDGSQIQLFHLKDVAVKAGQDLTGGQLLGHIDSTGSSTGTHLHFQVNQGGKPVDPWNWITGLGSAAGSASGNAAGGSVNPLDALKNVNDFFGHLVTPGHSPCSPPADEMGIFKVIDAFTCPQNWWKAAFISIGVILIGTGIVIYFFQEEKSTVVTVVHEAEAGAEVAAA